MTDYRKSHNFDRSVIAANLSQFDDLGSESSDDDAGSSSYSTDELDEFGGESETERSFDEEPEGSEKASPQPSNSLEQLMAESLKLQNKKTSTGSDKKHNSHSLSEADEVRSALKDAVTKTPVKRGNHTPWEGMLDNALQKKKTHSTSGPASVSSANDQSASSRRERRPKGVTRATTDSRARKYASSASSGNVERSLDGSHHRRRRNASQPSDSLSHSSDHVRSHRRELSSSEHLRSAGRRPLGSSSEHRGSSKNDLSISEHRRTRRNELSSSGHRRTSSRNDLSNSGHRRTSSSNDLNNSEHRRRRPTTAMSSRDKSRRGMSPKKQKSVQSPRRGKKDAAAASPLLGAASSELKW